MNFTGCGQTLRWHLRGNWRSSSNKNKRDSFELTFKLWRPTPSGSYTKVRPERSVTSSVHLSSFSARVDYQVAFSPGDIPGLSASNALSVEYTSTSNRGSSWYYWLITRSTSPTKWNPQLYTSTVASQLPLLSIEGTVDCETRPQCIHTQEITPFLQQNFTANMYVPM